MCNVLSYIPIADSGRRITVDDGLVIYVAKRGERSPSDSHWLIPSPPVYLERVYLPYASEQTDALFKGLFYP